MLDRSNKETTSAKGVVNHQRNTVVVSNLCDGLKVGDVVLWVSNRLDVDHLCVVVNGRGKVLGLVALDELCGYAEARKEDLELVVGSAVHVGGGDNVVAGMAEGGDGHELSGLSGGGGDSGDTTLESCDPLLKDIDSRLYIGKFSQFHSNN